IFGDGETSRDFCPVANVVQANLRAALASPDDRGEVYNVALGGRSSLRQLFAELTFALAERGVQDLPDGPEFSDFRPGDVRHSHADISRARADLGYEPDVDFAAGVGRVVDWALTLNQTTWPPQSS
ncbi:MAG: LPS biosynthesis protein WbpP, partial [Akkermansiaceae bacterium]|nr:LPS biosynthesis protein WbpP [Akkermansiaceae bacterium]